MEGGGGGVDRVGKGLGTLCIDINKKGIGRWKDGGGGGGGVLT